MSDAPLKVSVVVATYRSGEGLDRLIASLDAQTLPPDQWEAIFVDDGSPDDTFDRLNELARTRQNFRTTQIENSGWPCRPRNTGIEMARGEYIAFMDHDDELYPDALLHGHAFATEHGADVLNGKEARTDDAGWAIDQFPADIPQVLGKELPYGALTPTNPHKLYRRALLMEHGIRFREGGRVLWEDIFFNVDVLAKAEVVSTMSTTPYYHWYTTAGSGSTTFRRARSEWWTWLNEVIVSIDEGLAAPELAHERRLLREHQYRARLMDAFNAYYVERAPEVRKLIFEHGRRIQADHFPVEDDDCLDVSWRLRAELLRAGHPHSLDRLIREDPIIGPVPRATSIRWRDGRLHIDADVEWKNGEGKRHALRTDGPRIYKDLSSPFRELFSDDKLDVTDEIASASASIGVRSVDSRIGWLTPSESQLWTRDSGSTTFGVRTQAIIDPSTAAMGAPLSRGTWDISVRCALGTQRRQPMLRGSVPPTVSLGPSGVSAAHMVGAERILLDLSPRVLSSLVRPTGRVEWKGSRVSIEVTVDEILDGAVGSETMIAVNRSAMISAFGRLRRRLFARRATPSNWAEESAELVIRDARAWLEFITAEPAVVRFGDRFPDGAEAFAITPEVAALRRVPLWRSI